MKLSECSIGKFVQLNGLFSVQLVGHITGISQNGVGEVILIVSWQDGTESAIHPANLQNPVDD